MPIESQAISGWRRRKNANEIRRLKSPEPKSQFELSPNLIHNAKILSPFLAKLAPTTTKPTRHFHSPLWAQPQVRDVGTWVYHGGRAEVPLNHGFGIISSRDVELTVD
ncbi:predicted protein [Sclerotinia sclerotiorum 1980 UF-70]|uniref:Uncharacterized protein n=1 Tax=Sclerotinia sclerotiorum (strain ATCC 18683 / 1980 / Ss-1) TaxID=665079 RepID=A7ELD9_SCLS1|nr:predicted protein [Sclerotinia sclerotiorum 1980 UF-70]EDO03655.1 predicted protein [Sclerotinia sclerotiorum 1980 UF-70]